MFCDFYSLLSLPDLSKRDTSNVKNMCWMFCNCKSLISLTGISEWNISNVTNMECMFRGCKSLISLPDLSKGILIILNILIGCFMVINH